MELVAVVDVNVWSDVDFITTLAERIIFNHVKIDIGEKF